MVSTVGTPQQRTRRRRLAAGDGGKSSRKNPRLSSRLAQKSSSTQSPTSSLESTANDIVRRRTGTKARKRTKPATSTSSSTSASSSSGIPLAYVNEGRVHPGGWRNHDLISPKLVLRDGTTLRNTSRSQNNVFHNRLNPLLPPEVNQGTDDAPHYFHAYAQSGAPWMYYINEQPVRRYGKHKGKPKGPAPPPVHPGRAASEGSRYSREPDKKGKSRKQGSPSPSPVFHVETIGPGAGEWFSQEDYEQDLRYRQLLQQEEDDVLNELNGAGPAPR